jgi:hypothetical protein
MPKLIRLGFGYCASRYLASAREHEPDGPEFLRREQPVRNTRLKHGLGAKLRDPSYRDGLRGLFEAGDRFGPDPADQNSSIAAISRSMSSGRERR